MIQSTRTTAAKAGTPNQNHMRAYARYSDGTGRPSRSEARARLRIRIWIHTTGTQQPGECQPGQRLNDDHRQRKQPVRQNDLLGNHADRRHVSGAVSDPFEECDSEAGAEQTAALVMWIALRMK